MTLCQFTIHPRRQAKNRQECSSVHGGQIDGPGAHLHHSVLDATAPYAMLDPLLQVTIGAGTVVHPEAVIDASAGPIVIGGNNIIEEQACARVVPLANSDAARVMMG